MVNDLIIGLIIAIVQGITEWFPISSSGHIVLFEEILGFQGGLEFNVALHFGTLMAVFVYFGKDITDILRDFLSFKFKTENGKMALLLIVASIPAGLLGYFGRGFFHSVFNSVGLTALGFAVTGMFLFIASVDMSKYRINRNKLVEGYDREFFNLTYIKALLIGIAQAIAIVPGISRSGSTISAGVLLGLSEKNAMKFSFLMSIPIIFGANILVLGNNAISSDLIWATLVSFLVGLLAIHLVFKYILVKRKNFRWFGVYCILLAIALGLWILV